MEKAPAEEIVSEEPAVEPVVESTVEPVKEPEVAKVTPVKVKEKKEKVKKEKVKKVKKSSRKIEIEEEDEDERVYDEDGSIFKTKAWKKIWDKICLALLILAFLIPVGLLAYIILQFFK